MEDQKLTLAMGAALAGSLAWLVTTLAVPWSIRLARGNGATPKSDGQEDRTAPIPRLGGLAIAPGLAIAVASTLGLLGTGPVSQWRQILAIITGALIVFVVGLIHDVFGISALSKVAFQIVAASALVFTGVRFEVLAVSFLGDLQLGALATVTSVLWIVVVTNVIKIIDGLDGLAAGTVTIVASGFVVFAVVQGQPLSVILSAALVGCGLGFIRRNRHPARMSLGDSGALTLGFLLAAVSVHSSLKTSAALAILVPLLALGVPILDTLLVVARRLASSPRTDYLRRLLRLFRADRSHLHHLMLLVGLKSRTITGVVHALVAASCLFSLTVALSGSVILGFALVLVELLLLLGIRAWALGLTLERNGSVLLVNKYFWPDMAATAQLLANLAEDLVGAGVRVSVIAGKGSYALASERSLPQREVWNGVKIRRVWCTSENPNSIVGKLISYLSFLVGAGLRILAGRRHDVVVCLSTPPLVALLGLVAKLRGMRLIYKVEDLYPDIAIALGLFQKESSAAKLLASLSWTVLRQADVVVALDEAMQKALEERGARTSVVIPNWADGEAIVPDLEAGRGFRLRHGLQDRFVVLYSGNLGRAHRFDAVLEAARVLEEIRPELLFLFVGAGPRLNEVKDLAGELGNVRFLPYQPRKHLRELFNSASVHLVTLREEVRGLLVPSKYASALAAGKPVLLVGGDGIGLGSEIVTEKVGWVCDHDATQVRDCLLEAIADSGATYERGYRARMLFEARYDRESATDRWRRVVIDLVRSRPIGRWREGEGIAYRGLSSPAAIPRASRPE